jgi:hypothetical protein
MRIILLIAVFIIPFLPVSGQDTIAVVEKSIKIPALAPLTEYYGFAQGDKVIINISVEKGKDLKDFTMWEYPNTVKFAEHSFENVKKVLDISRNSIYRVEYNNTNIMPRVVNIKIQRIPRDASTRAFNTGVKWVDKVDTSYRNQETDYHFKADTSFVEVFNSTVKVNARSSADNTHRTLVEFSLPANTLRWVYWIGVGSKGMELFNEDQKKFASQIGEKSNGNPLMGVARGNNPMTQVKVGDNIRYFFISKPEETQKFLNGAGFGQFRQGDMVTDYGLMNYATKNSQKYFIGLSNENTSQSMDVHIKILAAVVEKGFETKGEAVPILSTSRVPVHEQ